MAPSTRSSTVTSRSPRACGSCRPLVTRLVTNPSSSTRSTARSCWRDKRLFRGRIRPPPGNQHCFRGRSPAQPRAISRRQHGSCSSTPPCPLQSRHGRVGAVAPVGTRRPATRQSVMGHRSVLAAEQIIGRPPDRRRGRSAQKTPVQVGHLVLVSRPCGSPTTRCRCGRMELSRASRLLTASGSFTGHRSRRARGTDRLNLIGCNHEMTKAKADVRPIYRHRKACYGFGAVVDQVDDRWDKGDFVSRMGCPRVCSNT